mmetsp:Transcript_28068/g.60954  ORF Transcript_28068/g.60954 Transcript_28068/m.60954 type:complete len:299 (-) Transcript_28068:110-1006(-)
MLVLVAGAEAVNRIRCEPTARQAVCEGLESLILGWILQWLMLAEERDHILQDQQVDHSVDQPAKGAEPDERWALEAMHARLAVGLEDEAGGDNADNGCKHRLRCELDIVAREDAGRDGTEHAVVVEDVDPGVRRGHGKKKHPSVASGEVEDHDAKDHIEQQIGVASHLHRHHGHPLGRIEALDLRVRANDQGPEHQGSQDGREWLDQERDQVSGWEGVAVSVLGQRPLHTVGLELLRELIDLREWLSEVAAEAEALHDFLSCEVRSHKVQSHVEQASNGVEDHVACLALILEPEADPV